MQSHTIDADTKQREASRFARHGNRYYQVDESYDKRVYENTTGNYVRIVVTLLLFWIFQAFHWWGVLSLGIVSTDTLIWYSLGCFIFTICFLAGILFSGKGANALKREHEYYIEKIAERRAEMQEKETKAAQDAAHQAKLAAQSEKLIKEKREAEAKEAQIEQMAQEHTGVQERQTQGYAINNDQPADNRLIKPDSRY